MWYASPSKARESPRARWSRAQCSPPGKQALTLMPFAASTRAPTPCAMHWRQRQCIAHGVGALVLAANGISVSACFPGGEHCARLHRARGDSRAFDGDAYHMIGGRDQRGCFLLVTVIKIETDIAYNFVMHQGCIGGKC